MDAGAMMTLGNMRENGVRSLSITCRALHCHHHAVIDVSKYPNEMAVPSFGPRMVCTVCGAIGADARPSWNERARYAGMSAFGGKADIALCSANVCL
jgi:hypothetical protein